MRFGYFERRMYERRMRVFWVLRIIVVSALSWLVLDQAASAIGMQWFELFAYVALMYCVAKGTKGKKHGLDY